MIRHVRRKSKFSSDSSRFAGELQARFDEDERSHRRMTAEGGDPGSQMAGKQDEASRREAELDSERTEAIDDERQFYDGHLEQARPRMDMTGRMAGSAQYHDVPNRQYVPNEQAFADGEYDQAAPNDQEYRDEQRRASWRRRGRRIKKRLLGERR